MPCPCCGGGRIAWCPNVCSYGVVADGVDSWDYRCQDATPPAYFTGGWNAGSTTEIDELTAGSAPSIGWQGVANGCGGSALSIGGIGLVWPNPDNPADDGCGLYYRYKSLAVGQGRQGPALNNIMGGLAAVFYEVILGYATDPYDVDGPRLFKSHERGCIIHISPCATSDGSMSCDYPEPCQMSRAHWSVRAWLHYLYSETGNGVPSGSRQEVYELGSTSAILSGPAFYSQASCASSDRKQPPQPNRHHCYSEAPAWAACDSETYTPDFHLPGNVTATVNQSGVSIGIDGGSVSFGWDNATTSEIGFGPAIPSYWVRDFSATFVGHGECCFRDCDPYTNHCCSNPLP